MNGLDIYNEVGVYSEVFGADGYRQIQMLLEKLVSDLTIAVTALENKEVIEKCKRISNANNITCLLRDIIAVEDTSALAEKLRLTYKYLEKRLFVANAKNDLSALQECLTLSKKVKGWWDHVAEK